MFNLFFMSLANLMDIPERTCSVVDADERVEVVRTIDSFFKNTKECIESIHDKSRPHKFEIKSGEIKYNVSKDSNDRLTYMLCDDRYVVVGVLETRTPINNVMYTFFRDLSFLEEPNEQ